MCSSQICNTTKAITTWHEPVKAQVMDLTALVFYGKGQSSSTVPVSEHMAHVRPSGPPPWLFGQKQSHQWPDDGHFVELWQRSYCSSLHKRANTCAADGLTTLCGLSSSPRLTACLLESSGDAENLLYYLTLLWSSPSVTPLVPVSKMTRPTKAPK